LRHGAFDYLRDSLWVGRSRYKERGELFGDARKVAEEAMRLYDRFYWENV